VGNSNRHPESATVKKMSRVSGIKLPGAFYLERWPWAIRALLGSAAAAVAVLLTYAIPPLRSFPLLLGFATVVLSAWFLGMVGGVFSGLTEVVLINFFLTRSELRFSLGNVPQSVRLLLFLLFSILVAWVIRRLANHRAQLYLLQWQQKTTLADVERQLAEERAKIDAALHDNSKHLGQLAAIVDSSDDVIISKDLNGIITSWNAAATRVFGYSDNEMIGASVLKLIPEHLHPDEQTILESIRQGRRIEHFDTVRLTKDGRSLDVSLTISPIKDNRGRIIGASKILRDVSDRKRMEQSLLQAEKIAATGRMAATIAHEINNPLEAVTNLLYLLRPMITNIDGLNFLHSAESELARVSHIAKQTLGYYREHAEACPVSLAEVALQAVAIYEPRCTTLGIEVRKALHSSRKIVLRQGEIMQVISNLIANSIYAMPTGGVLSISVEDVSQPEDGVVLKIRDTGVGIATADLPKIFDAFFTTRTNVGTGIGLFVAKQFVEGHGGRLEIESTNDPDNHGTTARIFLPLTTSYELASSAEYSPNIEAPSATR
jgi:PAS domain S-box-containing protein